MGLKLFGWVLKTNSLFVGVANKLAHAFGVATLVGLGDRERFSSNSWICTTERRSKREIERSTMGKTPVRMKVVVYALSPFQQKVMTGLWKDVPGKLQQKVSENWHQALLLVTPVLGTYGYAMNYKEKEKLAHRY
ncbi:hypothetical protein NE237_024018 [Protea cynaroides]|uniref:Cytochrome b-c1 complex subunit 8 n=1 Tax=Protea cynaroides TaxID=273540 RepID=A0A9Q0HDW8_9MAGN|nr:hypothetical protein NE237_024018 [Protea cynaroides]